MATTVFHYLSAAVSHLGKAARRCIPQVLTLRRLPKAPTSVAELHPPNLPLTPPLSPPQKHLLHLPTTTQKLELLPPSPPPSPPQRHELHVTLPPSPPQTPPQKQELRPPTPHQKRVLQSLPSELQAMILRQLPDLASQKSALLTSKSLHDVWDYHKRSILTKNFLNDLAPEIVAEAVACYDASRLSYGRMDYREVVEDFLDQYGESHPQDLYPAQIDIEKLPHIASLHEDVRFLAFDFWNYALSRRPITGVASETNPLPSKTELYRTYRAFYAFELFCNCFRTPSRRKDEDFLATQNAPKFSLEEKRNLFLAANPAYQVEELACIRDYIFNKLSDVIADTQLELDGDFDLSDENFIHISHIKENRMARGISYIRKLFSAPTKAKQAEVLLENNKACENRCLFITDALRLEPYDVLYEEEQQEAFYHKDPEPFEGNQKGPSAGWVWLNNGIYEPRYAQIEADDLRKFGYVMWDEERLEKMGVLKADSSQWRPIRNGFGGTSIAWSSPEKHYNHDETCLRNPDRIIETDDEVVDTDEEVEVVDTDEEVEVIDIDEEFEDQDKEFEEIEMAQSEYPVEETNPTSTDRASDEVEDGNDQFEKKIEMVQSGYPEEETNPIPTDKTGDNDLDYEVLPNPEELFELSLLENRPNESFQSVQVELLEKHPELFGNIPEEKSGSETNSSGSDDSDASGSGDSDSSGSNDFKHTEFVHDALYPLQEEKHDALYPLQEEKPVEHDQVGVVCKAAIAVESAGSCTAKDEDPYHESVVEADILSGTDSIVSQIFALFDPLPMRPTPQHGKLLPSPPTVEGELDAMSASQTAEPLPPVPTVKDEPEDAIQTKEPLAALPPLNDILKEKPTVYHDLPLPLKPQSKPEKLFTSMKEKFHFKKQHFGWTQRGLEQALKNQPCAESDSSEESRKHSKPRHKRWPNGRGIMKSTTSRAKEVGKMAALYSGLSAGFPVGAHYCAVS